MNFVPSEFRAFLCDLRSAKRCIHNLQRDKVTVLTKTWARDAPAARADLDRFRRELGTDYLDVCLMHCLTEGDWTARYRGVMDVLSAAKEKGTIRAHGCSCHSIEALRAAANSQWVEVDLARINPIGSHMDADPTTVTGVLREMKAAGKGVIGMKILGEGDLRNRQDEALRFALSLGVLDAFTIGRRTRLNRKISSGESPRLVQADAALFIFRPHCRSTTGTRYSWPHLAHKSTALLEKTNRQNHDYYQLQQSQPNLLVSRPGLLLRLRIMERIDSG